MFPEGGLGAGWGGLSSVFGQHIVDNLLGIGLIHHVDDSSGDVVRG